MQEKNMKSNTQNEEKRQFSEEDKKQATKISSLPDIQPKDSNHPSLVRIHFSEDHHLATVSTKKTRSIDPQYGKGRSIRQQSIKTLSKSELFRHKKVLVLYASGSSGADENLVIQKGFLKAKIRENQYLCDEKIMQTIQDSEAYLITPEQQNGMRIYYQIQEFSKINSSINMTIDDIKEIANKIYENYAKYDAFIVLCGFDVICSVSTMLSFMLQNLSKLVIFTGGYFPISYMRNDTINNLNESFSMISLADRFNDVIIVCRNKGYRGNRSIKMVEGGFASVGSPNLEALVSVNIKIKFREYLYLPVPTDEFRIWTNVSCRVGIIKFHILLNTEALQHELSNPAYDGFVIESYGSSNIPEKEDIWGLFKRIAEDKGKIFVNVAQPIKKQNSSVMKESLEKYHIYFGGDMTTEAALSKLSYLLSKKYSRSEIKRLLYTNMRGELTEMKSQVQFQIKNPSFIELVEQSLHHYYPSNLHNEFIYKIQNQLALSTQKSKQFQLIFKKVKSKEQNQQQYKEKMVGLINENNLLHRAVQASNEDLYNYFLLFSIDLNKEDQNNCSPLCYAIFQKDKKAIQNLLRKGCKIICNQDDLFNSFVHQLKQDNVSYFQMLYHVEFKETLKEVVNDEGRTALHLAALLKAQKCLRFLLEKFKFNLKQKDKYSKTYSEYLSIK